MSGTRTLKVIILGDGTGAEKALKDTADAGEGSSSRIENAFSNALGYLGIEAPKSLEKIAKSFDRTSTAGNGALGKLASAGAGLSLGLAATAVGVGIESVRMADSFQGATDRIASASGISVQAADKIGTAFLNTAGTTIYSGQQLATAFAGVAGQVKLLNGGVLNASAAMTVMKPAMDLAEASGDNLSSATSDVTKTLQAFGLGIKSSPLVSNVLYNASRDTGTSLDTLTQQIDRARATMGAAAPPIGQMGGLLLDLTQHGETGRAAMQTLNSAFTGLLAPTKAVTAAQKAAGVTFTNAQGQLLPLDQIITELQPKIAGMGNAQATATLKALGFGGASSKLVDTIQAGPGAFEKATAAVSKQNSVHEAAEKQAQTLQHQMETLKAAAEDYGVKLGQKLIPIIERLMKITSQVIVWLTKHKVVLIALAVVVGGVVVAAIGAFVASLFMAGGALSFLLGPVGLVIAIVAALAAAVYEIITHWSAITGFFSKMWSDVKHIFDVAWGAIKGFFERFWPFILGIMTGGLGLLVGLLIQHWSTITNDIHAAWSAIINFFTGIPGDIVNALSSLGQMLWGWIKAAWDRVTSGLQDAWTATYSWVTGLPGKILAGLGNLANLLYQGGKDIVSGIIKGIGDAWDTVWNFVKGKLGNLMHSVLGFFGISSPSKVFADVGTNLMLGMAQGIDSGSSSATAAMARATASLLPSSLGSVSGAGLMSSMATAGTGTAAQVGAAAAGAGASAPTGPAKGQTVNNYIDVHTDASAQEIASEVAWALRNH